MEKVKYMLLAPNKSPSVQSVFQPNEEKVSQSVVRKCAKSKCAKCVKANGEISA